MRKISRTISIVLVLALILSFAGCGSKKDTTVATVGKDKITESHITGLTNTLALVSGYDPTTLTDDQKTQLKDSAIDYSIEVEAIKTVVKEKDVLTKDNVKATDDQIKQLYAADKDAKATYEKQGITEDNLKWFLNSRYYIDAYSAKVNKDDPVTDEELKAYYDAHESEFLAPDSAHLYHILVGDAELKDEDKAKAEELKAQLDGGADFAEIAKANSTDTGSAESGGDLGVSYKNGSFVKEFEDAAFALQDDQISDVVQSQFGFHIIKATDVTKEHQETFDEAKESITTTIQNEHFDKAIEALKKKLGVKKEEAKAEKSDAKEDKATDSAAEPAN
ncbi:MAG: peptidylprolyl isomerase [Clostridiales Family XIII bacterium]|jgi:parvulin-like peptidyl-prolyl isomerase|nr:peptidylprolyl isomerase [Clostridiales Family XIII bacterium]